MADITESGKSELDGIFAFWDYSTFLQSLLPTVKEAKGNKRELDKFLIMFGRHIVKALSMSQSEVVSAVSKKHDWNSFALKLFDFGKIKLRSNADLLFTLLLQAVEAVGVDGKTSLTIEEIKKRIPMSRTGIAIGSSYNYAMIAMFGNQRERDCCAFENGNLGTFFTASRREQTTRPESILAGSITSGMYQPQPVRRHYIPKKDGKQRPLGIPTVRDRVIQMATKLVIEPVFEPFRLGDEGERFCSGKVCR